MNAAAKKSFIIFHIWEQKKYTYECIEDIFDKIEPINRASKAIILTVNRLAWTAHNFHASTSCVGQSNDH